MGFWTSLGSSAMSAASSMSLHDLTGGWSDFSSRKAAAKYESELAGRLMREEAELSYNNQIRALRESPSAYKAGLIAAGYNPMLAISDGVHIANPSVPSASSGHMPASDGSSKPFDGLARRVRETADAELENLKIQGQSIRDHIDFDGAVSAADVNLKNAQAQKIRKEADSINPKVLRQNDKYGNGLVGEGMRFVRSLVEGLGGDIDTKVDTPLKKVSTNSAKGIDSAVKVINDEALKIRQERQKRAREGLSNPRRTRPPRKSLRGY